jgi:iron complex transport system substrate-binding protein
MEAFQNIQNMNYDLMRVLSLIASSTEIVYTLGCGDKLVGRSHECDFPLDVLDLPYCTEPKFNINGSSIEIDNRVKSILQEALSVYRIDEGKLAELNPDLIITQSQCDVCAVSLSDVENAVRKVLGKKPRIVSLEPNQLSDIWNDIKKVASALKVEKRGGLIISELRERIKNLRKMAQELEKRTVACIEWIDPLMAAGNWMPELVELAGGINLFGSKGKHSPWMEFEDLIKRDPDVIIVMPCGYNIDKTKREMGTLRKMSEWDNLKAVQNSDVYLTDGNQYFNRPGPRLVESLEILLEILYDDKFDFGHKNIGWRKYI